jgi:hypothetical protein
MKQYSSLNNLHKCSDFKSSVFDYIFSGIRLDIAKDPRYPAAKEAKRIENYIRRTTPNLSQRLTRVKPGLTEPIKAYTALARVFNIAI